MDINEYEIDELLRKMAFEEKRHFAPQYICEKLGLKDIQVVSQYLLSLVPKYLLALWEVECPEGDSDFIVSHPSLIKKNELRNCSYCGVEYYPDSNRVWLAFNFNPDYVKSLKKKQMQYLRNNPFKINLMDSLILR